MTRIAFLGPEGTHTHEALVASGGDLGTELVPCATNHAVVLAVQEGAADRALAPLENSLGGGVDETLDALTFEAPDVVIVGELVRPVHHCLMAAPGTQASSLRLVLSHPQGLAQCAASLRRLAPGARLEAVDSTGLAAERAAAESGVGAVGSRTAAARVGAEVLAADIEDSTANATRFVWLAPRSSPPDGPATKSSVVFHGTGDQSPGWLARCLGELASREVNLTRIESRPLRSQLGHYLFHVDVDGGAQEPRVAAALSALAEHCSEVRVLGAYPAAPLDGGVTLSGSHGGYHSS